MKNKNIQRVSPEMIAAINKFLNRKTLDKIIKEWFLKQNYDKGGNAFVDEQDTTRGKEFCLDGFFKLEELADYIKKEWK